MNVVIDREDDGRFIAEVTDMPGVMAYGKDEEEARAAALKLAAEAAARVVTTAKVEREGDLYVALCSDVGVASQGYTIGEALANLGEAVDLCLESRTTRSGRSDIPAPMATKTGGSVKEMWKVPFREVYCETFGDMLRQTVWCHVVMRLFPNVVNLDEAPLGRSRFLEQYEFLFRRAEWSRVLKNGTVSERMEAERALSRSLATPECPYKLGYR